jgi:hypothetical protein
VAWRCDESASDEELTHWFVTAVQQTYPEATLLRAPGSSDETALSTP